MNNWFPHDIRARADQKIMLLIRAGGMRYYGLYWSLVELMHDQPTMHIDQIVALLETLDVTKLRRSCAKVSRECHEFVMACVAVLLFEIDADGFVTCDRVARNIMRRNGLKDKKRSAAKARWKHKQDADAMQVHAPENAHAMLLDNNRLHKKVNTEDSITFFTRDKSKPKSAFEVQEYLTELGAHDAPNESVRFCDYYKANGWKVGRNAMKDWKSACRNWARNNNKFLQGGANAIGDRVGTTNFADYDQQLRSAVAYANAEAHEPHGVVPARIESAGSTAEDPD